MVLDGHIHMGFSPDGKGDSQKAFCKKLKTSGIDGGIIISPSPRSSSQDYRERLKQVMKLTAGQRYLFPFFWIDPRDSDAFRQVDEAVKAGIKGFKVICSKHYPYEERPMEVYAHIAERDKPILFHSGILWDDGPSAHFNRPGNWECMLKIKGIRFAMAHISWPWVDEHVSVYGKIQSVGRRGVKDLCEMFIDTTPGTPPIYRRDALFKVFKVGYNVADNVFFGTDHHTEGFWVRGAEEKLSRDRQILAEIGVSPEIQEKYFSKNLLRFIKG